MKQMQVSPEKLIPLDFENQDLPLYVQQFQPLVFKEEKRFFVILGPNAEEGIAGSGNSLKEAMQDWDNRLTNEIDNPREGNETTRFVLDNLNTF